MLKVWNMGDLPHVVARAEALAPDVLAEARAAGFETLTALCTSMVGMDLPSPDDGDSRFAAPVEGGMEIWWVGRSADGQDLAEIEANDFGVWLTFKRLGADGTYVRTYRRPEALAVEGRNPHLAGAYEGGWLPPWRWLMQWLAGDAVTTVFTDMPKVRETANIVGADASFAQAWGVHRAASAQTPGAEVGVALDSAQAASLARLTMARLDVVQKRFGCLASLGIFAIFASTSFFLALVMLFAFGPEDHSIVWMGVPLGIVLVVGATLSCRAVATGRGGIAALGAVALVVMMVVCAGLPWWAALFGWAFSVLLVVAIDVGRVALMGRGRRWLRASVSSPGPVRPQDLTTQFPEPR